MLLANVSRRGCSAVQRIGVVDNGALRIVPSRVAACGQRRDLRSSSTSGGGWRTSRFARLLPSDAPPLHVGRLPKVQHSSFPFALANVHQGGSVGGHASEVLRGRGGHARIALVAPFAAPTNSRMSFVSKFGG